MSVIGRTQRIAPHHCQGRYPDLKADIDAVPDYPIVSFSSSTQMDWDAIGAIGEIVGAAAVVISVGYLAVQIGRQTDQSRLAATRELAAEWSQIMHSLMDNSELCEIFLRAAADYESLPNIERMKMAVLFQRVLRLLEQERLHISKGHIEPEIFESMNRARFEFLTFPGVQSWWKGSKNLFASEFQSHVDDLIERARQKGYESTFKAEREK